MKKSKILFVTAILLLAMVANLSVGFTVSAEEAVTFIQNADDLKKVGSTGNYVLVADINLDGEEWTPINDFQGTFDGNGKTISNFEITTDADSDKMVGFFDKIMGSATVKNLTLSNVNVTLPTSYIQDAGIICGQLGGSAKIGSCIVENSTITATSYTGTERVRLGGLVGYSGAVTIEYCESSVTVNVANTTGQELYVGGIVGQTGATTISYCINKGDLTIGTVGGDPKYSAGKGVVAAGIAGQLNAANAKVEYCVNYGTVKNENSRRVVSGSTKTLNGASGIVGNINNSPVIINSSYNLGAVSTGDSLLCGQIVSWRNAANQLTSSTSSGNFGTSDSTVALLGNGNWDGIMSQKTTAEIQSDTTYNNILSTVSNALRVSTAFKGYQTTLESYTNDAGNTVYDVRLISVVNGYIEKIDALGFNVTVTYTLNGNSVTTRSGDVLITTVYDSVSGRGETDKTYTASELEGDYIFVLACKNLPSEAENISFEVTTFYTYNQTHTVRGETTTFAVELPGDSVSGE